MKTITVLSLALSLLATSASATDWNGTGGNNSWSTPGNWVGGAAPSNDDFGIAVFGAAGTTFTPFVDVPWRLNRLDVTGAPFYNFTGNTITLGGAAAQINLSGGVIIPNALVFDTGVAFTANQDVTLLNPLSGLGGLDKLGPARLTIGSPTLYSGQTRVSAGTLQLGNGTPFTAAIFAPLINNAVLEFFPGNPLALAGGVSGTGSLRVIAGIVTSGAPFSHTGPTQIDVTAWITGQFTGGGPLTLEGRVDANDSVFASLTGAGQLSLVGGTITVGSSNTTTVFTGPLVGAGSLTKTGSGHLTVANASYFGGTTQIDAGTLRIGDGLAAPTAIFGPIIDNAALEVFPPLSTTIAGLSGSGTLTVLGGVLNSNGTPLAHTGATAVRGGAFLFAPIANGGPLTIDAGGQADLTLPSVLASLAGAGALNFASLTVGGNNANSAFTGPINGGPLQKVGSGRLTLAGSTMHGGGTNITAGTVRFGDGVSSPALISGIVVNDGALEFQAAAPILLNSGVSGAGTLRILGGVVTIAGTAAHTGATIVDAGILNASFMGNGSLAIAAGARVNATVSSFMTTLTGAGTLDIDFNGMGFGLLNASSTFDGVVSGAGGIFKTGTGTLRLTGASTTTGLSGVAQGTLLVTGTLPGPMLATGGTLGGTGTLGPVTVDAGATLSPGLSPGILNTGDLNLAGIALIELEGTTIGTQYDSINVTGTVTLTGATLTLSGVHVPAPGNTFTIINNDGADAVVGTFAGLPEGAAVPFNGQALRISYVGGSGNDVVLAIAAVAGAAAPIPTLSQWILVLFAVLLAGSGVFAAAPRRAVKPLI